MKKILLLILVISMTNCKNDNNNNIADANYQVEKDIKRYISLWDIFLQNRDTSVINSEYFTEDCIVVTAQGNKLIKHYNFKGKHTGDFFGIPASGNYLDLSGTTIVTMRNGKIAKEHDFYNMQTILDQLKKSKGDLVIDEQQSIN